MFSLPARPWSLAQLCVPPEEPCVAVTCVFVADLRTGKDGDTAHSPVAFVPQQKTFPFVVPSLVNAKE
jgi:hypothetical protein